MSRIWIVPIPPSTNALYRNRTSVESGPGRKKTVRYRTWIAQAGLALMSQGPRRLLRGHFSLDVILFAPREAGHIDADNVKALADLLKTHALIEDDRLMTDLRVRWARGDTKVAHLSIAPADNPWRTPDAPETHG